jgi:hypothetical protein
MNRRAFVLNVAALLGAAACRSVPALGHGYESAEALAMALLSALAHRDRSTLELLALSEREFRDHVWPALPASRPERNLPFSYVWGDLRQKSTLGLSRTLNEHGGHRYQLERVTFAGTTSYGPYRVHRDATFEVRGVGGGEATERFCGSMLEKGNCWKVFSYVVD